MATTDKRIDQFPVAGYMEADDLFLIVRSPAGAKTTNTITNDVLFGNVASNAVFTGDVTVNSGNNFYVNNMIVVDKSTPVSNSDTVTGGKFWFDDDYIYVATANNTIKRVALSTF